MGLHLNYELRLLGALDASEVDRVLVALHQHAASLPFESVRSLHGVGDDRDDPGMRFIASIIAQPYDEDVPPLTGDVESARGFYIDPGEGCETAHIGFLLRADASGAVREWFWHCSCKTQYASLVSNAHLIKCHTALVALLDHAISIGLDVVVRDETHYWETRDEQRLLDEVSRMNRIIAGIAGRLSDAIGPGHETHAPIFEHPRFERLEMGEDE